MCKSPVVSVVIPVYNGEKYLAEAIDGALMQTYQPLEVVVVNDGSCDRSSDIIGRYGKRIVSVQQVNQGVAAARNAGIRVAAGEFIAFLDQDDWWRPEKVERQLAVFLADDRLGLVHTGVFRCTESGEAYVGPMHQDARPGELVGECFDRLVLGNSVCNSSVIVRRSVLDRVGHCDPAIAGNTCQDYDLWLRIARQSRFGFVPEPLTVFRVHSQQGMQRAWLMLLTETARVLERTIATDGPATPSVVRRRMASLYDAIGVEHLDVGQRTMARQNFGKSLMWRASFRALSLWGVSFFSNEVIALLRGARARLCRSSTTASLCSGAQSGNTAGGPT